MNLIFQKAIFAFIFLMVSASSAMANPADHLMWHKKLIDAIDQQDQMLRAFQSLFGVTLPPSPVSERVFNQLVNPDDCKSLDGECKDPRTFEQHYFISSEYAAGPGSPVLIFLCGEWTCTASELTVIAAQAQRIHAHMITLEHRYYGQSLPFKIYTPDTLKFLSTRYAIDDIARFEVYAQKTLGLTGKWIAAGGSYSANMAAYYREKYPNLVVGALASSGPVMAVADFYQYDAHVASQLGAKCLAQVQTVVKLTEEASSTPEGFEKIKQVFSASEINDPVDFFEVLADMVAGTVQYGSKDNFCAKLSLAKNDDELLKIYAEQGLISLGSTAYKDSVQWLASTTDASNSLAWMWQICTEYGYWQTANHDLAMASRSSKITVDFYNQACSQIFGLKPVDTEEINEHYFEPLTKNKQASNIFFVNGTMDPWSELSIRPDNNKNELLTTFVVENGSHCSDLRPGALASSPQGQAQNLFGQMIDQWLK
jgi:pimeloyl-ACP methyl ester carboxylesterase